MRDTLNGSLNYSFADETSRSLARDSSRSLSPLLGRKGKVDVSFVDEGQSVNVTLPAAALAPIMDILSNMAQGRSVTIVPINAELTTQEAADLINVSRPFLVKLLKNGEIPFHKVGTHRRIRFKDLMEFKKKNDKARDEDLAELAREAQELGLGY